MAGNRLTIFDTTLRDGEQAPGFSLRIDEKLKMAHQLRALGVDIIEAGFPIASEADAEAVRMVSTHIRGPIIAALARCTPQDIERAAWALTPAPRRRIHVFIATSDLHLERKLRMTRDECLRAAMSAVRLARKYHRRRAVFCRGRDAQRPGVPVAGGRGGDPVGGHHDQPSGYGGLLDPGRGRTISSRRSSIGSRARPGDVQRSLPRRPGAGGREHACGADRRRPSGRVHHQRRRRAGRQRLARGGRHGHPGAVDRLPFTTGINATEIYPSSQLLTALTGEGVQANKAIVGRNAFAHEAGIHQDGMLKDRRTYEIMRPEEVGVPQATLVLGKHSGRHAVQRRCEQIGYTLEKDMLDLVYRAVVAHADREKIVSDRDLMVIVTKTLGAQAPPATVAAPAPEVHTTPAEVGYGHGV